MPQDPTQIVDWATNTGVTVMGDAYDPQSLIYPQFCRIISPSDLTDRPYGMRFTTLTSAGEPKRYIEGNPADADTLLQGYTGQIAAKLYAREMSLPYSLLETDNPRRQVENLVSHFVQTYGERVGQKNDELVADVLQKGTLAAGDTAVFDNSYEGNADPNIGKIYDGKALFATDHAPKHASGTYSNITASLALTGDNVQSTRVKMSSTNAFDERGKRIRVTPNGLIVPPELEGDAHAIVNTAAAVGSANNDANISMGRYQVIVNPYLTDDTDAWFMQQLNRGLLVVDSGIPLVRVIDDPRHGVVRVKCEHRFGISPDNWRYLHACNKATS